MKSFVLAFLMLVPTVGFAADPDVIYLSCLVKENIDGKNVNVTVKFAVENYDSFKNQGTLVRYPTLESEDEYETILVTPTEAGDSWTRMTNLNAQGGDLTVNPDGSLFLWGDGDGYQFTDLVVWDVDRALANADEGQKNFKVEGYVRNYGPAYMGDIEFKQFITCDLSTDVL